MTERSTGQRTGENAPADPAGSPPPSSSLPRLMPQGPAHAAPPPGGQAATTTQRTLPPPPAPTESASAPSAKPAGPGVVERVQTRLSRAAQEHRANAEATPPEQRRRTSSRRPARRARLRLTRIDPWSVMKTAFLLSIAFGVVTVVSVLMVWGVLGAAGVWDSINATVQNVLGEDSATQFDIENYLGTSRVIGFTLLVSVIDVVLLTAIATLAAFLYNMAAALLGGVEVTLAEEGR
ncbi:MAG: DUF3566 domain-containing protein [Nocardioides sp.]